MFDKVIRKAELLTKYLENNPRATYSEIEKETGIKRQTACRILKQIDVKKHDNRFKNVEKILKDTDKVESYTIILGDRRK